MRRVAAFLGLFALAGTLMAAVPATAATGTAVVAGVVRAPDGVSVPDGPVTVHIRGASASHSQLIDASTGAFEFTDLRAGLYYSLLVNYSGGSNIVKQISWAGEINGTPTFPIADGEHRDFDIRLIAGATVSGTIFGVGGVVLPSPVVTLYWNSSTYTFPASVSANGTFSATGLPPGSYRLWAGSSSREWQGVWWPTSSIILAEGQHFSDAEILVPRWGSISGVLTFDDGVVVSPHFGSVYVRPVGGGIAVSGSADATGHYEIYGLAPGSYTVCFSYEDDYVRGSCFGGPDEASATPISVSAGEAVEGVDGVLKPGGKFQGRVVFQLAPDATPSAFSRGEISFYRWDASIGRWVYVRGASADSNWGRFAAVKMEPGDYIIRVWDSDGTMGPTYWTDSRYFAGSDIVSLTGGQTIDLGDIVLRPKTIDVARIEGPDRFDVGANIAREIYPDSSVPVEGVPVVYIANGYNFPDALTASPAAALQQGVVLLVQPERIPPAVAAELMRLRPQRIVVAGGPASVSPAVLRQLQTYVSAPEDVVRAGGLDRYDASRSIVRDAWGSVGADMAIIATGGNFPDALSAGPAAASEGGPVILVDGSASAIDSATRQLILDLGIDRVYIAGGTGSVSPGVESSLQALLGVGNVTRVAGADRFEVGVLLSQEFFSTVDYAFVATGFNFPDALTGGPLAASYGAPLYLSRPECLPTNVAYDILDVQSQAVVLLGGPGSLNPAVERLEVCAY
jgi:putative cell wall-binding protein